MNQALAEMFRYNRWAILTLLDSCRNLTSEQLVARPPGVSGSIGELITHVVGGQQTGVLRTMGRQNEGEMGRWTGWPGIETVIEAARSSSDELIAIAEALDEDREVDLPYMGKDFRFPVSFFLVAAIQHGVEHRTEIKVA
ncbi:MAG TPA: DinB family protein [Dehalococcoidia bacterium]|nr:DinB family protein [Dehalococcoidia bacterium]